VPGKKITDHQVQKYKQHHLKLSQVAAAAKAGISERSARRIEHNEALPSQREERVDDLPPRNFGCSAQPASCGQTARPTE
jgi:hypothetical protein